MRILDLLLLLKQGNGFYKVCESVEAKKCSKLNNMKLCCYGEVKIECVFQQIMSVCDSLLLLMQG